MKIIHKKHKRVKSGAVWMKNAVRDTVKWDTNNYSHWSMKKIDYFINLAMEQLGNEKHNFFLLCMVCNLCRRRPTWLDVKEIRAKLSANYGGNKNSNVGRRLKKNFDEVRA
jgi:hypothetical protein